MSDELGAAVMLPEMRPAIASIKEPVVDEDGYVTHHIVRNVAVAVHTLQVGRGGWVCEFEDGSIGMVSYENVRFIDGEEG